MPATISNFTQQLDAATEVAVADKLLVHDESAGVPKYITGGVMNTPVVVTDATTYSVLAANSGRLHLLPDFTASCTLTLPTPAAGLVFEFMYGGAAADAHNAIITSGSDTNYFRGGVVHLDADSGTGADEVVPVYADGNSNSKLTITTPGGGTWVKMVCTGTLWFVVGFVTSATAPAFADQ